MILLAAIDGQIIFLIVAAAVGVVNWWLERKKKQAASDEGDTPSRPQRLPPAGSGPAGGSEQERLRRFLEALGVPQQPGAPQPPAQPPPRPLRQILPTPAPRPETPARRAPIPELRRTPPAVRPAMRHVQPAKPRIPIHDTDEMQEGGRLEEPATAIEGISREFESMTMEQFGVPTNLTGTASVPATLVRNAAAPIVESLRLALRTPEDLRTAFVTMELLGKPRGLQS